MVDASAGIFTGLYWVATGKTPMDALQDDDETEDPEGEPGDNATPRPQEGAWGGGRGFGR